MAVQPARMAQADLRHLPATPRLRASRSTRVSASVGAAPRTVKAPARPRTRVVRAVAATPWSRVAPGVRSRVWPSAVALSAIIVATMIGLVYVTQVLAAQNARYAVDRLLVERQALMRTLGSQEATIITWGTEVQVTRWAQAQGLDWLGQPVRVKAR